MNELIKSIIKVIIMLLCMQFIIVPVSNAASLSGIIQGGDEFLDIGKKSDDDVIDKQQMQTAQSILYNTLLSIGVAAAVIVGAMLGIKFMTSSAEGKADVKEKLVIYVVGCIVVFGAFGIWKLVVQVFSQLS